MWSNMIISHLRRELKLRKVKQPADQGGFDSEVLFVPLLLCDIQRWWLHTPSLCLQTGCSQGHAQKWWRRLCFLLAMCCLAWQPQGHLGWTENCFLGYQDILLSEWDKSRKLLGPFLSSLFGFHLLWLKVQHSWLFLTGVFKLLI